jgi:predicted nuclease of predicted toxin-antitoxin system
MKLLADESVEGPLVERLRSEGLIVVAIAEILPGAPDDVVLALANDSNSLLVTEDKDFGELVFRLGKVHQGVVLLRLSGLTSQLKCDFVADAFQNVSHRMRDAFTVITASGVRVRHKL